MHPSRLLPPLLRVRLPLPAVRTFATASPLSASRAPLYATESEARLLLKKHMKGACPARKELMEQINSRGRAGTKSIKTAAGPAGPLIGNLFAKRGGKMGRSEEENERLAKVLRNDRNSSNHVHGSKQSKPFWRAGSNSRKAKAGRYADKAEAGLNG